MRLDPSSSFFCTPARLALAVVLAAVGLCGVGANAEVVPLIQPGFFFDYNIPGQSPAVPITEQCQTINIKWGREGAIGANPVAPYSLVVYTSAFTTPFTIDAGDGLEFDWQVPFAPGTQYQICMWASNGVPGGCQATYTMIQNATTAEPTCANVTFPTQLLVNASDHTGPLSQFGVTDQCTDIKITPMSGKPPFTLTAAPPLHPPFNLTSNSMATIDWTLSLPWSYPFFLSLESSDGQLWSFGPLHAGGFGPTGCLAPGTISTSTAHAIAAGAGIGSAFAAGLVAALAFFLLRRLRLRADSHAQVDAFTTSSWVTAQQSRGMRASTTAFLSPNTEGPRSRTYVLHHDAGQAPVTVIAADSTDFVELPPRYPESAFVNGTAPRPPLREKALPPTSPLSPAPGRPLAGPSRMRPSRTSSLPMLLTSPSSSLSPS
ncbi:hypothetical protein HMN09_00816500 [Mycena chlorophos]|uniref:Uncharacterized protein n=1 Tax=Mycena chlorophos TaxID=658473 RepID=A0A8H6ST45_MYCCL|nr:hypothetical protein HMN09_00816500 [Mycena chlorophos]